MKERKNHFVRPLIDKNNTYRSLVDLNCFLATLFPTSELQQQIAYHIIQYLTKHNHAYLLKNIVPYIQTEIKLTHGQVTNPKGPKGTGNNQEIKIVSKDTIAKVFKMLWKSGITSKSYRYSPVSLSKIFASRLRELAAYWEAYVDQYK